MDSYIDININGSVLSPVNMIGVLVTLAHQSSTGQFAVDFPQLKNGVAKDADNKRLNSPLGEHIRFFGDRAVIDTIRSKADSKFTNGELDITSARRIPAEVKSWRKIESVRQGKSPKKALERLKNHLAKKGVVMNDDVVLHTHREMEVPYLNLYSVSEDFWFRSGVRVIDNAVKADGFSSYGFSRGGSVPVF